MGKNLVVMVSQVMRRSTLVQSQNPDGVPLVRATLSVLAGKWKIRILWHLGNSPKRYSELRQLIPSVSEKVLVHTLRDLEENNVIERVTISESPLKIEYRFTEYGQTLLPVFQAMCDWGRKHIENMTSAD